MSCNIHSHILCLWINKIKVTYFPVYLFYFFIFSFLIARVYVRPCAHARVVITERRRGTQRRQKRQVLINQSRRNHMRPLPTHPRCLRQQRESDKSGACGLFTRKLIKLVSSFLRFQCGVFERCLICRYRLRSIGEYRW